jgi:outer membrane receptor protein involved in Fe transport
VYGLGGLLVAERGATVAGLPNVPAPWSGTLTAEYLWPLNAETKAVFRSRWLLTSHNPGPFPELNPLFPTYDPRQAADPATQQWNISAALLKHQLEVNVYVDNVLNQHPTLQISGDAPGTPIIYAYTLRPRTIGLSVTWHR